MLRCCEEPHGHCDTLLSGHKASHDHQITFGSQTKTIFEIDEQIEDEIAKGVIPDPNQMMLELEQGAADGLDLGPEGAAGANGMPGMAQPETAPKLPTPKANEGEI